METDTNTVIRPRIARLERYLPILLHLQNALRTLLIVLTAHEVAGRDLLKRRMLRPAGFLCHIAAGIETAPCGEVDRAWNIALEQNAFSS